MQTLLYKSYASWFNTTALKQFTLCVHRLSLL
nr:MAG TPA: hypothetical protein [Caudoviricetes sp.]